MMTHDDTGMHWAALREKGERCSLLHLRLCGTMPHVLKCRICSRRVNPSLQNVHYLQAPAKAGWRSAWRRSWRGRTLSWHQRCTLRCLSLARARNRRQHRQALPIGNPVSFRDMVQAP